MASSNDQLADPRDALVRKAIKSIEFGLFDDGDVRSRSIVEITSAQAFDQLGTPLPGGLYDLRLGPFEKSGYPSCLTCGCDYFNCAGHWGHIELCVPVYHPLLFPIVVKILRCKCLHCHKLRIAKVPLIIYETKFLLLEHGKWKEALELDDKLATIKTGRLAKRALGTDNETRFIEYLRQLQSSLPKNQPKAETSFERAQKRLLQKSIIRDCQTAKKCPNCGAFSPKIRQDQNNKIFQAPLTKIASRINEADGITLFPALSHNEKKDSTDEDEEMATPNPNLNLEDPQKDNESEDNQSDKYMHVMEVQAQVRLTWKKHSTVMTRMFGGQSWNVFFMQAIPVPPSRFRPPISLGNMMVENGQNVSLKKVITLNNDIRTLLSEMDHDERSLQYAFSNWIELQTTVNCFIDSSKDPNAFRSEIPGIRQVLEKKEGIFRKHIMGKRVDYCCRSVVSPDPCIGANEIGLPRAFAETLTFPTPVSRHNVEKMRKLVIRGPHKYPGAVWVEFSDGRRVQLSRMTARRRLAIASLLFSSDHSRPTIVGRQMEDGDMVLMNRQPTLHKPGIMAHRVRVLFDPKQKTIRMHYANCNTYNADFDGDEMNCHFPQDFISVAECKYVAGADDQYIVPTDGSPLRGLIQDHVDAGVKLCCKDTFLEKWQYEQLLLAALASMPGLELIADNADIQRMPPALLRPEELWTGKQVISTILNHLTTGKNQQNETRIQVRPGISTSRKAKLTPAGFGEAEMEHIVIIRDGELLQGVLDKAAFGHSGFSMVHAVQEAYGNEKAGLLLNALGRVFTTYLQHYAGHSCRMEDLVLTKAADSERRKMVDRAYSLGARAAKAWADSDGGKIPIENVEDRQGSDTPLKPVEAASAAAKIATLLSGAEGKDNFAKLDGYMQSRLNPLSSSIIQSCLPHGLEVPFPHNTFGLMVSTGAKGSMVNQSQVSCALGQQALEGRRVPRLASGRTLPSFAPYDPSPRADGFIMDRFLTGIRPQEYYFHCMAGREGLVDTAVKTSRSGYLQRCLVKHLEELKVCYDSTVRNGEGGVIQFLYGEDGLDPTKAAYLDCSNKSFEYMARNYDDVSKKTTGLPHSTIDAAAADAEDVRTLADSGTKLLQPGSFVKARKLRVGSKWIRGALCIGWCDAIITRVHDEDDTYDLKYIKGGKEVERVPISKNLGKRCGAKKTRAECSIAELIKPVAQDPILAGLPREDGVHRVGSSGSCVSERVASAASTAMRRKYMKAILRNNNKSSVEFGRLIASKYGSALIAPGEAVGSIAAQSIGEPSTQMTLNTFHLAGSGANVTLGIPRLREIIMTASKNLKTPTMSVPLKESVTEEEAVLLSRSFLKLSLMELLACEDGIVVNETFQQNDAGHWERAYHIALKFHPAERINQSFGITLVDIAGAVASRFTPKLAEVMKRELRETSGEGDVESLVVLRGHKRVFESPEERDELEDEDDVDETEAIEEEDGLSARRFGVAEEMEYEAMDDEDREAAGQMGGLFDDDSSEGEGEGEGTEAANFESQDGHGKFWTPGGGHRPDELINRSDQIKLDKKHNSLLLPSLRVDPATRPLLMVGLVEKVAGMTLVRSKRNIDQAFLNEEEGRGRCLQTAGVNFVELWELDSVLHNKISSNDIWAVRCGYGVEAARNCICEQITSVFGAYGIQVDPRHLSLIADYMTFDGGFKAMNRTGMAQSSSPFLQMSFETTANFMTEAALSGYKEECLSPSANIVVGNPMRHGTGTFDILMQKH